jgi:hypothetical protein
VLGASNNGREDSAGCVITGEASFAHSGSVVDYESLHFIIISHVGFLSVFKERV